LCARIPLNNLPKQIGRALELDAQHVLPERDLQLELLALRREQMEFFFGLNFLEAKAHNVQRLAIQARDLAVLYRAPHDFLARRTRRRVVASLALIKPIVRVTVRVEPLPVCGALVHFNFARVFVKHFKNVPKNVLPQLGRPLVCYIADETDAPLPFTALLAHFAHPLGLAVNPLQHALAPQVLHATVVRRARENLAQRRDASSDAQTN